MGSATAERRTSHAWVLTETNGRAMVEALTKGEENARVEITGNSVRHKVGIVYESMDDWLTDESPVTGKIDCAKIRFTTEKGRDGIDLHHIGGPKATIIVTTTRSGNDALERIDEVEMATRRLIP